MPYNPITKAESDIIENKGTEPPFSGDYDDFYLPGTFICRRCNQPLFSSQAKFDAHCGWPAFDATFPNSVLEIPDSDGSRTEIQCANCQAHLGHVFIGERLTASNTRHCVNSLSLKFIPENQQIPPTLV